MVILIQQILAKKDIDRDEHATAITRMISFVSVAFKILPSAIATKNSVT